MHDLLQGAHFTNVHLFLVSIEITKKTKTKKIRKRKTHEIDTLQSAYFVKLVFLHSTILQIFINHFLYNATIKAWITISALKESYLKSND